MHSYEKLIQQLIDESQKIILGKELEIKLALATFMASSHLLIEDIPGVGKYLPKRKANFQR